jgi:hypothetical protein
MREKGIQDIVCDLRAIYAWLIELMLVWQNTTHLRSSETQLSQGK